MPCLFLLFVVPLATSKRIEGPPGVSPLEAVATQAQELAKPKLSKGAQGVFGSIALSAWHEWAMFLDSQVTLRGLELRPAAQVGYLVGFHKNHENKRGGLKWEVLGIEKKMVGLTYHWMQPQHQLVNFLLISLGENSTWIRSMLGYLNGQGMPSIQHRIRKLTYTHRIWLIFMVNVGVYIPYMDPMGYNLDVFFTFRSWLASPCI